MRNHDLTVQSLTKCFSFQNLINPEFKKNYETNEKILYINVQETSSQDKQRFSCQLHEKTKGKEMEKRKKWREH